jgi:hypothetical protein
MVPEAVLRIDPGGVDGIADRDWAANEKRPLPARGRLSTRMDYTNSISAADPISGLPAAVATNAAQAQNSGRW